MGFVNDLPGMEWHRDLVVEACTVVRIEESSLMAEALELVLWRCKWWRSWQGTSGIVNTLPRHLSTPRPSNFK